MLDSLKQRGHVGNLSRRVSASGIREPESPDHAVIVDYLPRFNSLRSAETVCVRRRCSLSPDRHEIKIEEVVCVKGGHPVRGEAVEDWKERPRLHGGAASLTGI